MNHLSNIDKHCWVSLKDGNMKCIDCGEILYTKSMHYYAYSFLNRGLKKAKINEDITFITKH